MGSWDNGSRISIDSRIPKSLSWIRDSKAQDFGFLKTNKQTHTKKCIPFPESRNPERSGEGPGSSLQKPEPALLKLPGFARFPSNTKNQDGRRSCWSDRQYCDRICYIWRLSWQSNNSTRSLLPWGIVGLNFNLFLTRINHTSLLRANVVKPWSLVFYPSLG